jgi:hypothetical protein
MSTRRQFLKQTVAAGVIAAKSIQVGHAASRAGSRPNPSIKTNASVARIRSVIRREETVRRYGGLGDNWHMSWAADDRQYVSLCDGAGFSDQLKEFYNSRMLVISGSPSDATFHDLANYPVLGPPTQGPKDARYYSFGTLAIDGHLYQFMSTMNRSRRPDEETSPNLNDLYRYTGAKLIYSPDDGRTWHNQDGSTPVVWEPWDHRSRENMVFFREDQEAFSLLTVLQMGRNYQLNRDGYVYVYAPNGNTEGTMNELVMFRVPRAKVLERGSYEFFAGRLPNHHAKWTKDITARAVVHTFPRGWVNKLVHPYAWQPSVVYNAPLNVFMMANWGTGTASNGMWFGKASYLGFWIAPNPWGPWVQTHEETAWLPAGDKNARAYQPQIAPKWIAADGRSFWLVWSDFQAQDSETLDRFYKEEIWDKYWRDQMTDDDWARMIAMTRKHMPYYTFNTQRVDLVVA